MHDMDGHDYQEGHGSTNDEDVEAGHDVGSHAHQHHGGSERPMFATVTVAVCHCGAGCVIGDLIGEWLVYGTGIAIHGRTLWPEYLIGTRPSLM